MNMLVMPKTRAVETAHTLSDPAKMPGKSYSLPVHACKTGTTLRTIEGSVCSRCYADNRGNYRFSNVKTALEKRLESITHPKWTKAMVSSIVGEEWFRWHDSGDLQSMQHFINIADVAEELEQTNFWLPTKERGIITEFTGLGPEEFNAWPSNLVVRWSMPMIDQVPNLTEGRAAISPQLKYSMVSSSMKTRKDLELSDLNLDLFFVCEARQRDNNCGYCRACWDEDVPVIIYPLH